MTNQTLERLSQERSSQETFIAQLLDRVEAEQRDITPEERRNLEAAEARLAEIQEQAEPLIRFEERRASMSSLAGFGARTGSAPAAPRPAQFRSIGEQFVESEQLRSYSGRGTSDRVDIEGVLPWELETRALISGTTDPGKNLLPEAAKFRGPERFRRYPLLDMVSRVETSATSVEVVVTSDATGADVVLEGAKKPEISWTSSVQPYTLAVVAGWQKATRNILDDVPQMRGLVESKLNRALLKKLNELAYAALSGAFTAGNTTTGAAGADMLTNIRIAIGELQARGIAPSAIGLNPADYAAVDLTLLEKTLGGAVMNNGVFGLEVVPIPDLKSGEAVVGDIGEAMTWFARSGGLSLYVTDSDVTEGAAGAVTSDFIRNILTFLLETKGVFVVTDPQALQKVAVTPKTTT